MEEWIPPFLKQLELLTWSIWNLWFGSKEKFDIAKLFISYTHNPHFSKLRQYGFYAFTMDFSIFHTGTMTHIDGELKHGESILNETLSEFSVFLDIFLRLSGKIE